jgi:DNA-binding HxlR family transcriptional regulator
MNDSLRTIQKTKQQKRQSDCPINYTFEVIANKWAFLVLRDIVYYGKHTYNEFLASAEGVTTSMLADRLADLEREGILQKTRSKIDGRKEIYSLTDKGLSLIPVLIELSTWGIRYDTNLDRSMDMTLEKHLKSDRAKVVELIRESVKAGRSVFVGEGNVINKLKAV